MSIGFAECINIFDNIKDLCNWRGCPLRFVEPCLLLRFYTNIVTLLNLFCKLPIFSMQRFRH
jgi:hypothetical protein